MIKKTWKNSEKLPACIFSGKEVANEYERIVPLNHLMLRISVRIELTVFEVRSSVTWPLEKWSQGKNYKTSILIFCLIGPSILAICFTSSSGVQSRYIKSSLEARPQRSSVDRPTRNTWRKPYALELNVSLEAHSAKTIRQFKKHD